MGGGTTLANNVMLNASGQATFTTSSLTSGSHGIQANFKDQGAGCNAGNNLKNSNANLTQVVNKADTTTTVASSLNPSVFGQSVTLHYGQPGRASHGNACRNHEFHGRQLCWGTGSQHGVATFGTSGALSGTPDHRGVAEEVPATTPAPATFAGGEPGEHEYRDYVLLESSTAGRP
jgi:hypothetical protein